METKKTYVRPEVLVEEWKFWKETNHSGSRKRTYEVSNFGRGRINGELVDFSVQKSKYYTFGSKHLHRIVAELFIPNTENKPCVDHIDTNKHNNVYWNLRWCTQKENCNNPRTIIYKYEVQNRIETKRKKSEALKSVLSNPELRKKRSETAKIVQNRPEVKQKQSESHIGKPNPNKGKHRVYNDPNDHTAGFHYE